MKGKLEVVDEENDYVEIIKLNESLSSNENKLNSFRNIKNLKIKPRNSSFIQIGKILLKKN